MTALYIALAGGLGAVLRFSADKILMSHLSSVKTTLLINCIGSLVAGFLLSLKINRTFISEIQSVILITGFCGGFTTFSAYSLQLLSFFEEKNFFNLFLFFILAPILTTASAYLGFKLAQG